MRSHVLLATLLVACSTDATPSGDATNAPDGASDTSVPSLACGASPGCGGELVGAWLLARGCSAFDDTVTLDGVGGCPSARREVELIATDDVHAVFNPSGTFSMGLTGTERDTVSVPDSCLGDLTCEELSGPLAMACGVEAGGCVCRSERVIPQLHSGTYAADDGALTLTGPTVQGFSDLRYCVRGDTLSLAWIDALGAPRESLFVRGQSEVRATYANVVVLNAVDATTTTSSLSGDAPEPAPYLAPSAVQRAIAGTNTLALGGHQADFVVDGGSAAIVVAHPDAAGVVAEVVPRADRAQPSGLRIFNASGRHLTVAVATTATPGAIIGLEPSATATRPIPEGTVELAIDEDADGVPDVRALPTPVNGFAGFEYVAVLVTGAGGHTLVFVDDGVDLWRAANVPLHGRLRVVQASPTLGAVAFMIDGEPLGVERFDGSPFQNLLADAQHVVAQSGDTVLASLDVTVGLHHDVTVALLDDGGGAKLFAYRDDERGEQLAVISARADCAALDVDQASSYEDPMARDLGFGSTTRYDDPWNTDNIQTHCDGEVDTGRLLIEPDVHLDTANLFLIGNGFGLLQRDDGVRLLGRSPLLAAVDIALLHHDWGGAELSFERDGVVLTKEAYYEKDAHVLLPEGTYDVVAHEQDINNPSASREVRLAGMHVATGTTTTLLVMGQADQDQVILPVTRDMSTPAEDEVRVTLCSGMEAPFSASSDDPPLSMGPLAFGACDHGVLSSWGNIAFSFPAVGWYPRASLISGRDLLLVWVVYKYAEAHHLFSISQKGGIDFIYDFY